MNSNSHSKKWRSLHKVGVLQHQLRLEIVGDIPAPSAGPGLQLLRCNTRAAFSFSAYAPFIQSPSRTKTKRTKKKKPKQSFYHYKFSYETGAAAFKIKVKVLSLKKQTKLPAKKPTSVQVCTSEDNSKDHYRPQFKLKHDSQTALEKNSSHCKSHLQLTSVLINTYTHTCHTHTNPSFPHPSVQSAA